MEDWKVSHINMPIRFVFCHGILERCFKFRGKPMRVCSRCFGVFVGQTFAFFAMVFIGGVAWYYMGLMLLPMAMDWSIQKFLNINSNNIRRFITGLLGGFGIGFIQLKLVITVLQMLWG